MNRLAFAISVLAFGITTIGGATISQAATGNTLITAQNTAAAVADRHPGIAVDPAGRSIGVDPRTIARLGSGDRLTIAIVGDGRFDFIVDHILKTDEILEISGHLVGDADKRMNIGMRGDIVTGLISTPKMVYAVGYGNNNQVLIGRASTDWMADTLRQQLSVKTRKQTAGEQIPATAVPVDLDISRLNGMKHGETTAMQLPEIGAARITLDSLTIGENTTWIGHLADYGTSYTATITYSASGINGYILTPAGAVSLTMSNTDQAYLFNPGAAGFKSVDGECTPSHPLPAQTGMEANPTVDGNTPRVLHIAQSSALRAGAPIETVAAASVDPTIDVLIYYTPGILSVYGGIDRLTTRIDQLIALSNQAYTAGKLSYRLRRVGIELANIQDNTSNNTVLTQFVSGQGVFSTVAAKRNAVGADLVTILRPLYTQTQGSCGVAYVSGAGQTNVSGYANYAYSVISDGNDRTGLPYYCDDLTFAHELGHNMGLMHDRATVAQQSGGVSPLPTGATAYAYGYAVAGKWGSIMSYTFPHLVKFSNPLDSTCNGNQVCGIPASSSASADNVQALGLTMPIVANFRPTGSTATPTNIYLTGTVTINGRPTGGITLVPSNSKVSCTVTGTTGFYTCTIPRGTTGLTVTPAYRAPQGGSLVFQPKSLTLVTATANATQNFSGTLTVPNVVLSGTVTINGTATAGVKLTTNNTQVSCTSTTSNGTYSCTVPKGTTNLTLTPSYQAAGGGTISWQPASAAFASIVGNTTRNFAGKTTASATLYTVEIKVVLNRTGTITPPISIQYTTPGATPLSCTANPGVNYLCKAPAGTRMTLTPGQVAGSSTIVYSPTSQTATINGNTSIVFNGTRK